MEAWLLPQLKGETGSVIKSNLFGEQFVRGKLYDDTRLFDVRANRTQHAPAAGTTCEFILQPRVYALNGKAGLSFRVLSIQPK